MKSGVTLQQMLTEVKRQSESKEDYLIAPNRLRMECMKKKYANLSVITAQTASSTPGLKRKRFMAGA